MKRHHIDKIIICALALSVALPAACMAASPVPNKRDQAIKLYGAKNYRAAVELLDEYLLLYPNDIIALYAQLHLNVNRCRQSASATS